MSQSSLQVRKKNRGTTLIEVLVVIAVFAIGILAVAQVFPRGFKILTASRDISQADALAKGLVSQMQANPDPIPDEILPVVTGTSLIDPNRDPLDPSIYDEANVVLNGDGTINYKGNPFSDYHFYTGANVFRHIVGDGVLIPAPRTISANYFGALVMLHYGPTRQLPNEATPISLYGSHYTVNIGQPPTGLLPNGQVFLSSTTDPAAQMAISLDDPSDNPAFRISLDVFTQLGGTTYRRYVQTTYTVGAGSTIQNGYLILNLSSFTPTGETYEGYDPQSVTVQRIFQPVTSFSATDPYQYIVLNLEDGELLINPLAYNYQIQRIGGTRIPLSAKADYDVLDWQILHDTFRLQDDTSIYRLKAPEMKVLNSMNSDGVIYRGIQMPNLNATGTSVPTDVVFMDVQTGSIVAYDPGFQTDPTRSSVTVDKSNDTFQLNDVDAGLSGIQIYILPPDPSSPTGFASSPVEVNANGRVIEAFYRVKGDWSIQPLVACADYEPAPTGASPLAAQYQVATNSSRIYFAPMEVGRKVSVDDLYYIDSSNVVHEIQGQSFVIRNVPADPNGPYIDVKDFDPNAVMLDYSHGYAVSGIHGMSVGVRIVMNPTTFEVVTGDPTGNISKFQDWIKSNRSILFETYSQRGSN